MSKNEKLSTWRITDKMFECLYDLFCWNYKEKSKSWLLHKRQAYEVEHPTGVLKKATCSPCNLKAALGCSSSQYLFLMQMWKGADFNLFLLATS